MIELAETIGAVGGAMRVVIVLPADAACPPAFTAVTISV